MPQSFAPSSFSALRCLHAIHSPLESMSFTELCNRHHTRVLEQFHHPKRNPVPIVPWPLARSPTFCLWGFAFPKHANKQKPARCGRLGLAAPSLYAVLKAHAHRGVAQCSPFSWPSSIPLCARTASALPIRPLRDICVVSAFCQL